MRYNITLSIVFTILLLSLVTILSSVSAYEEVYRDVTVDSNHWYFKRYTTNCTFNMTGTLKGYGLSIRNSYIGSFAGVKLKSGEHARRGSIYVVERIALDAKEGVATINESSTNERYSIEYLESWPTKAESIKLISYRGRGISVNEWYENNGDVVYTKMQAEKLVFMDVYSSTLLGMKMTAIVTPDKSVENRVYNKTIDYALKSGFQNGVLKFKYYSCPKCIIDEDYYGNYTVNKNINLKEGFYITNESKNQLSCP